MMIDVTIDEALYAQVLTESLKNVSEAERQGAFTHMKGG